MREFQVTRPTHRARDHIVSEPHKTRPMTSHSCSQQRRRVFQVLHGLQHKNIVKLQDAYETPSSLILVCELATGGELMHRIAEERSVYTEEEVKRHLLVMLDTIKYMHSQGAPPHTAPAYRQTHSSA